MKKSILASILATTIIISLGVSTSAFATVEENGANKILVIDSENGVIEPRAIPAVAVAAARAAAAAWKAIPAGDRVLVTQGLQAMIGLGGVQNSEEPTLEEKDLEYLFDK